MKNEMKNEMKNLKKTLKNTNLWIQNRKIRDLKMSGMNPMNILICFLHFFWLEQNIARNC